MLGELKLSCQRKDLCRHQEPKTVLSLVKPEKAKECADRFRAPATIMMICSVFIGETS